MVGRFREKFNGTRIRLKDAFRLLPIRIKRLFLHFFQIFDFNKPYHISIAMWWSELIYLILDVFAIPEIYETFQDWLKFNSRPMTENEIEVAKSIFGNSINYSRIRIDEKAQIGCRHWHFLYVSFYTINAWGVFDKSLLIHELVHVWQFEKFGGVYIPRAIKAIKSREGYNYGGISELRNALRMKKTLLDFNYEQMADIVTDYFRLKMGGKPQWGDATQRDLAVYEKMCAFLTRLN